MRELNGKFFETVPEIDLLIQSGEELVKLPDYFDYDLTNEELKKYSKLTISNFVDGLISYLKKIS